MRCWTLWEGGWVGGGGGGWVGELTAKGTTQVNDSFLSGWTGTTCKARPNAVGRKGGWVVGG